METTKANPDTRTRDTADDTDSLTHLLCRPCRLAAERQNKPVRTACGQAQKGWDLNAGAASGPSDLCIVCRSLIGTPCQACGHAIRYPK